MFLQPYLEDFVLDSLSGFCVFWVVCCLLLVVGCWLCAVLFFLLVVVGRLLSVVDGSERMFELNGCSCFVLFVFGFLACSCSCSCSACVCCVFFGVRAERLFVFGERCSDTALLFYAF